MRSLKRHHLRVSLALSRVLVGAVSVEQQSVSQCSSLLDINVPLRPAAGIVGVVAHLLTGGLMQVRRSMGAAQQVEQRIRKIRIEQGKRAVSSNVSLEDRARVLAAFKCACQPENEKARRKIMEERIQSIINQGGAGTVTTDESQVEFEQGLLRAAAKWRESVALKNTV